MKKSLYFSLTTILPFFIFAADPKKDNPVAEGDENASLIQNSPFIPGFTGTTSAASSQNLELKGIFKYDESLRFSIYDKTTKKSVWVTANDKSAPFEIKDYDPEKQKVTIVSGGRLVELILSAPSASSSPMQQLTQSGFGGYPMPSSPPPANFGQPSPGTSSFPTGGYQQSNPSFPSTSSAYPSPNSSFPSYNSSPSSSMPSYPPPSLNKGSYTPSSPFISDAFDDDFDDDDF